MQAYKHSKILKRILVRVNYLLDFLKYIFSVVNWDIWRRFQVQKLKNIGIKN